METEDILLSTLNRLEEKVDKIIDKMVTREDCKTTRENCNNKEVWSTKKIIAIGTILTGTIGAVGAIIKIIVG
jgi:hypothetical protein